MRYVCDVSWGVKNVPSPQQSVFVFMIHDSMFNNNVLNITAD